MAIFLKLLFSPEIQNVTSWNFLKGSYTLLIKAKNSFKCRKALKLDC